MMNIWQCEQKAKEEGFDSMEFVAFFPNGPMNCKWLDAYFGSFIVDNEALKGSFLTTKQIGEQFPDLKCIPLEEKTGCFE
jgi:hypothetical protein